MNKESFMEALYTEQQARNNAKPYKEFYIGTMSLRGDSRFVTFLFDEDMNEIESAVCTKKDMMEYVDKHLKREVAE